jgi:peptidoglycan hydrolase CwlO-like protein
MSQDTIQKIVGAAAVIVLGAFSGKVVHHASHVTTELDRHSTEIRELISTLPSEQKEWATTIALIEDLQAEIAALQAEIETMQNFDQQAAGALNQILNPKTTTQEE